MRAVAFYAALCLCAALSTVLIVFVFGGIHVFS